MKKLAIIPARGGSKRIPHKNIKEFCGRPIIYYSIKAAIDSGIFDEVMVSTDDSQIAQIAKSFGAKVPFMRSNKASDDFATTADVIEEVLKDYKDINKEFDFTCCIYPTAPFITSIKLEKSFEKLKASNAKGLIPVVEFEYPIQRALRISEGKLGMIMPENINKRSQDLEKTYHDIGQFYWLKVECFLEDKTLFSDNTISYSIPHNEARDIDTPQDWIIAEALYKCIN